MSFGTSQRTPSDAPQKLLGLTDAVIRITSAVGLSDDAIGAFLVSVSKLLSKILPGLFAQFCKALTALCWVRLQCLRIVISTVDVQLSSLRDHRRVSPFQPSSMATDAVSGRALNAF